MRETVLRFLFSVYSSNHGSVSCSLPTSNFAIFLLSASIIYFIHSLVAGLDSYWKEKNISRLDMMVKFVAPILTYVITAVWLIFLIIPSYVDSNYSCNGNGIFCYQGDLLCETASCSSGQCLSIDNGQWHCSNATNMYGFKLLGWFMFCVFFVGSAAITFVAWKHEYRQNVARVVV